MQFQVSSARAGRVLSAQLGMHLTQVAPTGCYLVRGNLEGLAMWA